MSRNERVIYREKDKLTLGIFPISRTSIFQHPALEDSVPNNVFAAGEVEFFQRVGFVRFDGFHRDVEFFGNFLVAVTESNVTENFRFSGC